MKFNNILDTFLIKSEQLADAPFLYAKKDLQWDYITWQETRSKVESLAGFLTQLQLGEKPHIMIIMENRPEYIISVFSILSICGIVTSSMPLSSKNTCEYIAKNSLSKAIILSNYTQFEKISDFLMENPLPVICCDADSTKKIQLQFPQLPVFYFHDIKHIAFDCWQAAKKIQGNDICNIIYTSGTGGMPKGVMITHKGLSHNVNGVYEIFKQLKNFQEDKERFLSFLPFAHIYEFMVVICIAVSLGAKVYCVDALDKIAQYMIETKPTIMTAVPRLYETMVGKIKIQQRLLTGLKSTLFALTLKLGNKKIDRIPLNPLEKILDLLVDLLIRQKIRSKFGGKLKTFVSGGGRLDPEVGRYLVALGIPILQGYGLSETSPVVSVNLPNDWHLHTVGPILDNTELKFADDGEIMVRGDLVMAGYWQNEQATNEVLTKDGWLYTGDIGKMQGNHLVITDRKKDLIKNRGGENISPQKLEGLLNNVPEISQSLVYGENQNYIVALIVLNQENCMNKSNNDIEQNIKNSIAEINKKIDKHEEIKKFIIAEEPFSISNNQMSPTLKMRRTEILRVYGDKLRSLYN